MTKFKSFATILLLFVIATTVAQKNSLNKYKYIIVPSQFEFQSNEDEYQANSLLKFLFQRKGFTTFLSNETIPADLANNACIALRGIIVNSSSMFSTKMEIKIVDCFNNVLYLTEEATSREKDYKKSYHEAIRKAFEEIDALDYTYTPQTIEAKKEIIAEKVVEKEIQKPIVKEVVQNIDDIQVKKEVAVVKNQVVEEKVIEKKKTKVKPIQDEIKEIAIKPNYTIEGKYEVEKWGICTLSKTEEGYSLTAGDEKFEFAVLYNTSKSAVFIVKYAAYKQPQLIELGSDGNLKVDSSTGVKIYKRIP